MAMHAMRQSENLPRMLLFKVSEVLGPLFSSFLLLANCDINIVLTKDAAW